MANCKLVFTLFHDQMYVELSSHKSHTKLIFCFLCWSISLLPKLCNEYSAYSHSTYTTCTQWLHQPRFYIYLLAAQVSAFCSFVPQTSYSTLVSKKKPGCLVIFKQLVVQDRKISLCGLIFEQPNFSITAKISNLRDSHILNTF